MCIYINIHIYIYTYLFTYIYIYDSLQLNRILFRENSRPVLFLSQVLGFILTRPRQVTGSDLQRAFVALILMTERNRREMQEGNTINIQAPSKRILAPFWLQSSRLDL